MKLVRYILQDIEYVDVFPQIAFVFFFVFFLFVLISVIRTKQKYMDELAEMPFESKDEIVEIQSNKKP
jgi:cbb3-type cytochrome oxidase subunit 3